MEKLYFTKLSNYATIPTKRDEDAGYDIYPCFEEDIIIIPPLTTALISTGIATAFDKKWYAKILERGSTGSKGIKVSAGVIDSGFRGEWLVAITNSNNRCIVISKKDEKETKEVLWDHRSSIINLESATRIVRGVLNMSSTAVSDFRVGSMTASSLIIDRRRYIEDSIIYPYTKAIAQFVMLPVPVFKPTVISKEELLSIKSVRGSGLLGSSNK